MRWARSAHGIFVEPQVARMKRGMNRREFVGSLAVVPFALEAALAADVPKSPFPIIDTHIHLFDKSRPEGAPYPRDLPDGGEPPQGMIAVPGRYKAIAGPFGVVGAVVVEASPRLEDNQWILDEAAKHPVVVGLVGRIDPADAAFGRNLDRFTRNTLFLGIRQGQLDLGLDKPEYMANLKRLADADCSLDVNTPALRIAGTEVLVKVLDKVPNLRLVMDHLPEVPYSAGVKEFQDRGSRQKYVDYLKELGRRPQVYIKLSEVVHRYDGKVLTDLNMYKELWSVFGEDRIMFGSDFPQSEGVEFNSLPNVINVARAYVMSKNPAAMEMVFWKNSMKPYRWVQRDPSQRKS